MAQIVSLVSVKYRCRWIPPNPTDLEKHKQIALMSLSDLAALGRLLKSLTSDAYFRSLPDLPDEERQAQAEDLDTGLHVLGKMIAALADQSYGAMVEYIDLMENGEEEVAADGKEK